MDLESLRTFCNLYENKSFTKTAEELGLTEATVSYRIKELEKYVGTELIIRKRDRTIYFTEKSTELYEKSQDILEWLDKFRSQNIRKPLKGTIRMSSGEVAGIYFLASAVKDFRDKHPEVVIRLDFCSAEETFTRLQNREIDLGFSTSVNFKKFRNFINSVKVTELFPIELIVITPLHHPLLEKKIVDPSELLKYNYVARFENSAIQAEIDRVFEKSGIKAESLNVVYKFPNSSSVISAVAEGLGVYICSKIQAIRYVQAGMIGYVPMSTDVKSYIYMIDRHKGENELVNIVDSYIRNYVKTFVGTGVMV